MAVRQLHISYKISYSINMNFAEINNCPYFFSPTNQFINVVLCLEGYHLQSDVYILCLRALSQFIHNSKDNIVFEKITQAVWLMQSVLRLWKTDLKFDLHYISHIVEMCRDRCPDR